MTREQNFRTSCISQFATSTGWQFIQRSEIQKLPTVIFPAFSVALGKTKYTAFDPMGKAISGEQDFTITVYYSLPLRSNGDAYPEHSDITNNLEQFINNPMYVPPGVSSGDNYRIERTMLIEAKAPAIQFGDTRYVVNVTGKYIFTMF